MNGNGDLIETQESTRLRFEQNLPPREVLVSLVSHDPENARRIIKEIGNSPLTFFKLLGLVSPGDCTYLFEQQNHFGLWEMIADSTEYDAETIADAAKKSIGEENLGLLARSLVHSIQDTNLTQWERWTRAVSGVNLASALPLPEAAKVIAEYSNLARLDNHFDDASLLDSLRAGVHTFHQVFYENMPDPKMDIVLDMITNLRVFTDRRRDSVRSDDDINRRIISGNLGSIRNTVNKEGLDIKLAAELDELMKKLGYKYEEDWLTPYKETQEKSPYFW